MPSSSASAANSASRPANCGHCGSACGTPSGSHATDDSVSDTSICDIHSAGAPTSPASMHAHSSRCCARRARGVSMAPFVRDRIIAP
ncbi:putative membrane domain protein [Burkholderia pseudomallei]|nr:putative membrane domain protein [Burkholderia pseudomallei]